MSLLEKLKKNSTVEESSILSKSKLFNEKDVVTTSIPMLNVALSGNLHGGLTPGITEIAGPSKHFKSNFALLLIKAYQTKYPDSVVLFYDSEFGTPESYWTAFEIDRDRVVHTPITDVEILKIDLVKQLYDLQKGERVLIVIDSIGQLASRKEVEDAQEGKTVADMSRAKSIKSLFRLINPHLRLKDIPLVLVNHTYKEIGMFPKDIPSGGTGPGYSSNTVWIVGRQQEKEGTEVIGYKFIINVEKSRFVKEKSKIPIMVKSEGGIETYSGLLDVALEGGFVTQPSKGWYTRPSIDVPDKTGKAKQVRETGTLSKEFWEPILENEKFQAYVRSKYEIASGPIFQMEQSVDTESTEST